MIGNGARQAYESIAELTGDEHAGHVHDNIVVSPSTYHAEDPGSIPGRGI